jgi:hypothetical protein
MSPRGGEQGKQASHGRGRAGNRRVVDQSPAPSAARGETHWLAVATQCLPAIAVGLWWLAALSLSSRVYYPLHYSASAVVSPWLEPFAATPWAAAVVTASAGLLAWLLLRRPDLHGVACLGVGVAPWFGGLLLHGHASAPVEPGQSLLGPEFWTPLWLALWTSLAVARCSHPPTPKTSGAAASPTAAFPTAAPADRYASWCLTAVACGCGVWWCVQSWHSYRTFQLGFNDFGHFTQRVASTAQGRGFLLESPVLPAFWDHFNPGLVLLVPAWWLFGNATFIFYLQAACLAGSSLLIAGIARGYGHAPRSAALWGAAWLMHPSLGQMNLAYSYGWHPITLAIPLLLAAIGSLLYNRRGIALAALVLAISMEEGVLVVVSLTMLVAGLAQLALPLLDRAPAWASRLVSGGLCALAPLSNRLPAWQWLLGAAGSAVAFLLVFKWSGLAEFQTGRFHTLGASPLEVLLSPVQRPDVFWSLLLRERNAYFVACLLIPCFPWALARGWLALLPLVPPLGLLLIWDHLPAQCIAFHYPSLLLPLLWLAAISGSRGSATAQSLQRPAPADTPDSSDLRNQPHSDSRNQPHSDSRNQPHSDSRNQPHSDSRNQPHGNQRDTGRRSGIEGFAAAALAGGLVTSLCFGQFPWSSDTLKSVQVRTFQPDVPFMRDAGSPDQQHALQTLAEIRAAGGRVLATGRFASHLVGVAELETVGQFLERKPALAQRFPSVDPLQRYDILILDRLESFQQTRQQTLTLEAAALQLGFQVVSDRFEIVHLQRTEPLH